MPRLAVFHADNLAVLRTLPDACVDLIYIDPPFNTGKVQRRTQLATVRDENGDRVGFKGQLYRTIRGRTSGYDDRFDDFLGFLQPRMEEAYRILAPEGSLFFHLDYREIHYCKVMLDRIFGRSSFINEIIWAYDYGARSKKRWPAKHDNILWYAKNPEHFTFNFDAMDRIPYMAPALVGPRKAALGKTPTDVWWHTIVSPNGREKTGYATQKPRAIIDRIVKVHSNPGDVLCDFFAGSGTLGESAFELGRNALLVDCNLEAVHVMRKRFSGMDVEWRRGAARAPLALRNLTEAREKLRLGGTTAQENEEPRTTGKTASARETASAEKAGAAKKVGTGKKSGSGKRAGTEKKVVGAKKAGVAASAEADISTGPAVPAKTGAAKKASGAKTTKKSDGSSAAEKKASAKKAPRAKKRKASPKKTEVKPSTLSGE